MKTISTNAFKVSDTVGKFIFCLLSLAVLSAPLANAANGWWDNSGATGNWGTIGNWSNNVTGGTSPASIPGTATTDLATFSITSQQGVAQTANLTADRSLGELSFINTAALSLLAGGTNRTLTLAGISGVGITKAGTGAVTIGSATAGQQVAIALSADQSFVNDNNTGAITIVNGVASSTAVARALTLNGTSTAANTISGVIADNGAGAMTLDKAGAGTWVLSGNNTYSGGTTVASGTLTLSGNGTFGTGTVNISGGTIDLGGKTITNSMGIMFGGTVSNGSVDLTGHTWEVRSGTVSANLTGTGGVTKTLGGNTVILAGNNTHTGETWVSFGTLQLDNVNAVQDSTVRFEGGGFLTFGLSGSTYNLGNLKGSSALVDIAMGTNTLSVGGNNGSYTYAGMLSGTGGFTKVGTGALTLTNTGISYTGQLTVKDGTLSINSINNASNNGVLGNNANAVILGNTGGVTGSLLYTAGNATSNKKFTMAAGGTGNFNVSTTATELGLSGVINGSGNMTKTGTGTLTVNGTNTYTGTTTVSAGTFFVDGNQASATGTVDIQSTAKLGGIGTIGGNTTIGSGATLSPGHSSTGILAFSQNLSFTDTTSQVLMRVASGVKGTNYDSVTVGGSLAYSGNMTLTINSALAEATYDLFAFTGGKDSGVFNSIDFALGGYYSTPFVKTGGGATFVANTGTQLLTFTSATGDLTVIPEPTTIALLVLGTTYLLWRRRKSQNA